MNNPNNLRNAGRKSLPDHLKAKIRSLKLTDDDYEKFKRLGSAAWLREILKSY